MTIQRRIQAAIRKPRDDSGFSMIQMVITMVAAIVLGLLAFNIIPGFLGQAETTAVQNNVREVARALASGTVGALDNDDARIRAASVDGTAGASTTGAPAANWLAALGSEFPGLSFNATWLATDADNAGTIRVQFIVNDNAATSATDRAMRTASDRATVGTGATAQIATAGPLAPGVPWVTNDHSAVRIRARDGDNWACALIVLNPDFNYTVGPAATPTALNRVDRANSRASTAGLTHSQAASRIKGVWFDEGTTMAVDNGLHHCSPADFVAAGPPTTHVALLPANDGTWTLDAAAAGDGLTTMRRSFE